MKRLAENNINTPEEYDRIFIERAQKAPDYFDLKRWKLLLRHFYGGAILDAGCLDSYIPSLIIPKLIKGEASYTGIDVAQGAIMSMHLQHQFTPNVEFKTADVYDTKLPDSSYDYIVAGELIEHLENPKAFISEAMRVLKPGGVLAISTPLGESHAGEVDCERHLWSFEEQDMHDLMSEYGTVRIKTMRSRLIPYRYHFPTIIAHCFKS